MKKFCTFLHHLRLRYSHRYLMVDHHFPFRNWGIHWSRANFPGTRHWGAVQPPNRATMKAWWHTDRSESGDRSIQGQFGLCLGIETNLNYGFSWFKQPDLADWTSPNGIETKKHVDWTIKNGHEWTNQWEFGKSLICMTFDSEIGQTPRTSK
jgi:hypothetical protein